MHGSLSDATSSALTPAAFFDLDHTVIRRSTPVALAGTFHRRGLVRRIDLLRAAGWQLIFMLRGPSESAVRKGAEDGMILLKGIPVDEINELLGEAMERVLRPLVYDGPLDLLHRHHERGEPVYILSASLHEVVQHIADDLGFDGGVGSTCEIVDGVYTGRSLRPCYGEYKAQALRDLADRDRLDLAHSTAYSDSWTDIAFLEAVGHPVAVNPDKKLRAIADARSWPILRFDVAS